MTKTANAKTARFISFEGVEGVGKTTIITYVREQLRQHDIDPVVTREPGGTPIAEAIRSVLLGHYEERMCPDTELLLMFSGRAQNIAQVIRPALNRGQWVLSDRFTDASLAYQGGGRGIASEHILELKRWVQGELEPDMTILLDAPVAVGVNRLQSRGARDRIEAEGHEFFERVRQTYLSLAQKNPERFRVCDANQSIEIVKQQVWSQITTLL